MGLAFCFTKSLYSLFEIWRVDDTRQIAWDYLPIRMKIPARRAKIANTIPGIAIAGTIPVSPKRIK